MKVIIHHLNKQKNKIGKKEIDLTKYSKIGTTGKGIYFQPKRGKGFEVLGHWEFDLYKEHQNQNDKAVENNYFTYKKKDKSLPDSTKNRVRDHNGKPIHIYEQPRDLYKEYKMAKKWFIDNAGMDLIMEYIKKIDMKTWTYDRGKWIED